MRLLPAAFQTGRLPALFVLLLTLAASHALAQKVPVRIELRDGTVLRAEMEDQDLPWHIASAEGSVTPSPIKLSQVEEITLVQTPVLAKMAKIKRLISQLGDNDFFLRESAERELIEQGTRFVNLLKQAQASNTDPEVGWRLEKVLRKLPTGVNISDRANYDLAQLVDKPELEVGDLRDWEAKLEYQGQSIAINRKYLHRIAKDTAPKDSTKESVVAAPASAKFTRIPEDVDSAFPAKITRIDFELGPTGEELIVGENLAMRFVPLGCIITSTLEKGFVSVETYNVRGRSKGNSIATHEPKFNGGIEVRFCVANQPDVPAGVHYVGFSCAQIVPNGTILEAFDARDRRIALIKTVNETRDFLSIKSETPIAWIRITGDAEIDGDFAIDDLTFDPPKLLVEASDPRQFSVCLKDGCRFKGSAIAVKGDELTLQDVTCTGKPMAFALAKVAAILPPARPDIPRSKEPIALAMLKDGSVWSAKTADGLQLVRLNEKQVKEDDLVAIWGNKNVYATPAETEKTLGFPLTIDPVGKTKAVAKWKLGPTAIEGEGINLGKTPSYETSPLFLFSEPPVPADGAGLLRLVTGEQFVLGKDAADKTGSACRLIEWNDKQFVLGVGEKDQITVPMSDVVSVILPAGK